MSEMHADRLRDRVIRDRNASQIRRLRMYAMLQMLGILGALLIVLAVLTGQDFWEDIFPLGGSAVYVILWSSAATLAVTGLSAWAMTFLQYGITSPSGALQLTRFLEIGGASNEFKENDHDDDHIDIEDDEDEELTTADNIIGRLTLEINDQGNRANLNLVIGGITAFLALALLVWTTVDTNIRLESAIKISSTAIVGDSLAAYLYWGPFISKIFMSSSAAFFAFFFLSTYRRNLAEIRYFHNELTNVEARVLAAELCGETSEGVATKLEILKSMGATERNFILRKGESTTDLAQKELDRKEVAAWADALFQAAKRAETRSP